MTIEHAKRSTAVLFGIGLLLGALTPEARAGWTFADPGFFTETVVAFPAFTPVGLTWSPDNRMFIWTKNGTVRIVKGGALLPIPFLDISSKVNVVGDRGLLGLVLDPDYAVNGYVYLLYTYEEGGDPNSAGTKVALLTRVTSNPLNPDVALAGSEVIILGSTANVPCPAPSPTNRCIPSDYDSHSIGSLRAGPDGKLWVSVGDGASYNFPDPRALRSQNLDSFSGKILRINFDGTAPGDNPFDDGADSVRSRVWAYGLRNPYRFDLHPLTGVPFVGDVGWYTWEEVNRADRGRNLGWPCYEGVGTHPDYQAAFSECRNLASNQVTPPLYAYYHDGSGGSAAIGGPFYQGNQYPAQYVLSYFWADYTAGWIRRMVFDSAGTLVNILPFASNIGTYQGGLVSLELGPDGLLYYVEFTTGAIGRIKHTSGGGSNLPPVAVASASPSFGYAPLTVAFSGSGSFDPEGFALSYQWDFGDGFTSTAANPSHTYSPAAVTTFTAALSVTDTAGLSSSTTTKVTVGSMPPVVTITAPAHGTQISPGQTIDYAGSATDPDPEDAVLPESAFTWTILLHHNTHVHILGQFPGSTGSVVIEDHDPSGFYSYELILTVTDSSGLSGTDHVLLPLPDSLGGPVVALGMNEVSGTSTADESGNGHTGTLISGPTWGVGQYGGGIVFDGVDDAVSVAGPGTIDLGADFTVLTWIKRSALGGGQRHILSKCSLGGWATGCKELYFTPSNTLSFGSFGAGDTLSATIADNAWHHVAVTFERGNNTLRIYVDGVLQTTATRDLEADGAGHVVTIGNLHGTNPFSGTIDELRIYSRTLSAGEVLTAMGMPIAPVADTTPPVLSNGQPVGTLPAGTTQATLSATTNENATCRWDTTAGVAYASMSGTFGTTGGTTHSTLIAGLVDGQSYGYHVRCQDVVGNTNTVDYSILFAVAVPDTTLPTVGLTAPAAGATVSGTVTVSATASDNVGVAGVQFLLDGAPLLAEDTTTPYSISWTTTSTTNGAHTLSARARDAAGNLGLATNVGVTVSNDTTLPTVGLTAPAAGATVSGTVTVSATASDNVGVVGVQFLLDGAPLLAEDTTTPYSISWTTTSTTNGAHTLSAQARDAAGNLGLAANVGVTVSNALPTGLVAALGMNEVSGTSTADASGNGHTGTLVNGPTWGVGQYGGGIVFDGTNDSVSVASPGTINLGADFTAMTWLKRNALGGGQRHILAKCSSSAWANGCKELYFNSSNQLSFGSFATGDVLSVTLSDTAWHHLAVTFTRSTNTLRIYVDGTLRTTAISNLEADGAGHVVTIGNMRGTNPFSGTIDELRIYNRTLSAGEVLTAMGAPIAPVADTTPPVLSNGQPVGTLPAGTTQATLSAATNENATCRWDTTAGVAYASMSGTFGTTGGTTHSTLITGLVNGQSYSAYVRCQDVVGNTNAVDYPILFAVAAPDTTLPTVGLTAPAAGATVSGTVTVSATASDNVGVVGVQFLLDGAPLLAEDTTTPYSISWTTTSTTNGAHTLSARARDAAGNLGLAVDVGVTVSNADTTLPTVGLTAPAAGATVSGTVTVSATASDNVGVVGVQFLLDGAPLLAEDTTTPYSISWTTTSTTNGAHTLSARARDAAGNLGLAADVGVTVSNADTTLPTVGLTAPAAGATVSGTVTVSATASDNVGVVGVQFLLDGAPLLAEDTTTPYSISWTTTSTTNGAHTLSARARDAAGNLGLAADVGVTVSNADTTLPTVGLTAPTAGATVSGTVTVSATASDNVGVVGVQFLLDGAPLLAEDTTTPYSISWTTTSTTNGAHTLSARARDAAGNLGLATNVGVTVSNDTTLPTVGLTAPAAGATVSGTVTVSATASDNVGVVGVQFLLDGAPLLAEDTTTPYSISWTTTSTTNGAHTLSARARDAAGNLGLAVDVGVTVSNAIPTGLVAALGMNEVSGTSTADASGNGHTGTLVNGPVWGVGQYGGGIVFDGVDDTVSMAGPGTIDLGADFTVMTWFKRNVLGGGQRHILAKCSSSAWTSGCKELYFNSSNQLSFGSFATGDVLSATVADTAWHHLAVTFTRSTNTVVVYVDGTLRTTATSNLEADGAGHVVTIGNLQGTNPFSGTIDELRIYSRTLSAGEVVTVMSMPIAPVADTTPPVLSNGQPVGTLPAGTTQATLSATTNENATCRWDTTAGVAYASMSGTFGTTGGTTHSTLIAGLVDGQSYGYHVRCQDVVGNTNTVDYSILFAVAVPDTTLPTVGLTAPAAGATVSGTVTVSATASDNVGVVGVQFLLDGAPLLAEDTTTPYSISWTTTSTTNGAHTLSARARDVAGNLGFATNVGVTVSNVIPTGLVAALGMNEVSGTSTADASGNGHTGTLVNGPTWGVGQYGGGIVFDGTNDSVSVASPGTINLGADFTVMTWFKRNALGGGQRHILAKCSSSAWTTGCKELYFTASNRLAFGSFATGDVLSVTLSDTAWHHLAVTFTRSTNTLRVYVDGTLRTTATSNLEADGAGHVVTIGNMRGTNPFSGTIDELRIYSKVLSAGEIVADQGAPIP